MDIFQIAIQNAFKFIFATLLINCQGSFAVALNPNGTGQVLLYPYYTVTDNQDTLISITNTRNESKLLRLTMRESLNSEIVYSFDLILRPYDHWSGVITLHNDGAALLSGDTSCTVPTSIAASSLASTGQLAAFEFKNHHNDEVHNGIERTHSGHIEVFEMGVLDESISELAKPPIRLCRLIEDQYAGISEKLSPPTGGIHGHGIIINPEQGTAVNFDAEAIVQFTDKPIYQPIASGKPDLSSGNSYSAYLPNSYTIEVIRVTEGGGKTLEFENSIDAVSALFMAEGFSQDFVLEEAIKARSYWIATSPTKYLYADEVVNSNPFTLKNSIADTEVCVSAKGAFITISIVKIIDRQGFNRADAPVTCQDFGIPKPPACFEPQKEIHLCHTAT